jgi:hypothetical protein
MNMLSRDLIEAVHPGPIDDPGVAIELASDDELAESLRRFLLTRPDRGPVWLFAYGSLMWKPELPVAEQAGLELVATDALLLGLSHLYLGKVDPEKLSSQWNFASRPVSVERGFQELTKALDSGYIRETFERARPQHVWYQRGREALRTYRAIAAAGGWSPISDGPTMKLGLDDPRVPALRYRLTVTGDLAGDLQPPAPPMNLAFDAELEAAVKRFQERHGLTADGAVGPGTRAALNVPVAARIDQIRINLERARWVMHELHGEFVLINVAGFDVSYFRNDEPVWTSKVVVGRDSRETPIFRSTITYVVFNPTWTIPPSAGAWPAATWDAMAALGLNGALVPEDAGGVGPRAARQAGRPARRRARGRRHRGLALRPPRCSTRCARR